MYYYKNNTPTEAPYFIEEKKPHKNWPEKGEIVFEKVFANYDQKLPFTIKNISFKINSEEKIGIVGRFIFYKFF